MSGEREAYEREAEGSAVRILVADDDPLGRELLTAFVERLGYAALAVEDGAAALEAVRACAPDLVLSDVSMPGMNGFDLCRRLKGDADMRLIPVVLITGIGEEFKRQGIEAGADEFLSKPVSLEELRLRLKALLRMKAFTDDLESAEAVLCTLGRSIEAKDAYTEGHCERLAGYAAALGEALGLGPPEMRALRLGGSLHDLGKVGIPEAVLLKAGPLTPEEWAIMQRHPILGEEHCRPLRTLRSVLPISRHHHERWDGSGYPDGLRGEGIPLLARVLQTADLYDAMTTDRPYRRALSGPEALAVMRREAERGWWDRELLQSFEGLVGRWMVNRMQGE